MPLYENSKYSKRIWDVKYVQCTVVLNISKKFFCNFFYYVHFLQNKEFHINYTQKP